MSFQPPKREARRRVVLATLSLGTLAAIVPGRVWASLVTTIPRIKPSVVAVGTFQRTRSPAFRFLGTGFAVGNGSLIATNAHVLPGDLADGQRETLAIAAPEGDSQRVAVRPAVLAGREDGQDLAVLRIEGPSLPALTLASGNAGDVPEGQEIAFTGFPMGSVLGFSPVTHRGIISAVTPIGTPRNNARELDPALIRRLGSDPFRIYQLDATAYPGNSGSPLYDPQSGRVIGVINMVFVKSTRENVLSDPSGISYAIPVQYLRALLARMG